MNAKLLAYSQIRALPTLAPASEPGAIRRIFNNEQLIERFGKWLLICGKSQNTRINYELGVRQFGRFLDKPLTAATKEDVRGFIATLYAKRRAPSTIQMRLDTLRVFFDCLTLGGQVRTSVPRFVTRRKIPQRLPQAKSEEDINRILAAASKPRDIAILELLYASGIRVAELSHLRCEDLNIRARSLTVRKGKGGDDRLALFGRKAATALRAYLGDRQTGPVFRPLDEYVNRPQRGGVSRDRWGIWWGFWRETGADGKRKLKCVRLGDYEISSRERARLALESFFTAKGKIGLTVPREINPNAGLTTRQIWRIVAKAAKRAGVAGVHPHTFRHSMATHCLDHGMDIRHVQELLGHTSLVATQKYLHLSVVDIKRIHAKFFPGG
jgi:site-specific recombinase XerD